VEIARRAEERKRDFERLLDTVDEADGELRSLFKKLYLSNTDPASLIDTAALARVKEENPDLFRRAVSCFSRFAARRERKGARSEMGAKPGREANEG